MHCRILRTVIHLRSVVILGVYLSQTTAVRRSAVFRCKTRGLAESTWGELCQGQAERLLGRKTRLDRHWRWQIGAY